MRLHKAHTHTNEDPQVSAGIERVKVVADFG